MGGGTWPGASRVTQLLGKLVASSSHDRGARGGHRDGLTRQSKLVAAHREEWHRSSSLSKGPSYRQSLAAARVTGLCIVAC